ncbi:MAG: DUF3520 domain-containing protein, partial [bacterium]|nr:DUF3520 domain-containing protein [bacterium]
KDVKIQVEFNPVLVDSHRLIGYENRVLKKEDFNDDQKDAGELGAGHTVTALYELVPAQKGKGGETAAKTDKLRFQEPRLKPFAKKSKELALVKLRYKKPDGDKSRLLVRSVKRKRLSASPSTESRFAAAVAMFGMKLRGSQFLADTTFTRIHALAEEAVGRDRYGYRAEFLALVKKAASQ